MPSAQTRVNLTLPDEVIAVLDRMVKVTGAGRATIIREWLIEAAPQLGEFARALEMASKKNVDAFSVMAKVVNDTAAEMDQLSLDMKRGRRRAMRKKIK
jgi:metal-responsive CopG/Arc/MetJ family transcriptional regulator